MSANVKANKKQQEIKDLVAVSYIFYKKYPQNLKYNVTTGDLGRGLVGFFADWTKSVIYIYIFFEAIIVLMCNDFPRLLKTHFFIYFANILQPFR